MHRLHVHDPCCVLARLPVWATSACQASHTSDAASVTDALRVQVQAPQLPPGHVTVHLLVVKNDRGGVDRDWNLEDAPEADGAFPGLLLTVCLRGAYLDSA